MHVELAERYPETTASCSTGSGGAGRRELALRRLAIALRSLPSALAGSAACCPATAAR